MPRRSRRLRAAAVGGLLALLGSLAVVLPAEASVGSAKQVLYPQAGPYVYSVELAPRGKEFTTVVVAGAKKRVRAHWIVRELGDPGSKVGGDTSSLPRLQSATLTYYQAHAVEALLSRISMFETPDDLLEAYEDVVDTSAADAKRAYERRPRLAAQKRDVNRAVMRMYRYVGAHYTADYIHAHKRAVVAKLKTLVQKSASYTGTVSVEIVSDSVIDYGTSQERYIRYAVTIRNSLDRVAYRATANTHDGPDTATRVAY